MPHNSANCCYEFGPYRLDMGQRVLTRAGDKVALTPKATHLLTLLVCNAGSLIDKDALLREVWRDTFVEESNLTQNIFLLRRALGDEPPGPRYIETVARRGYRFVASVRSIGAADSAVEDSVDVEDAKTPLIVAVLPFVNATGDPELEYLVDGLTENLVNNLSRVSKLRVMSRSAVFRYKKKQLDPRVIGKELGVGTVLVGKLDPRPGGLAINVELVEVGQGWQLWGESFDCEPKNLLELQDAITRQVLGALKLKLSGDEEKRVTARYTENAEAYQSYLEGRYHWSKYTRTGMERAILHFRQAIELDPTYALSYAGIIDCYLRLATNYLPPEEEVASDPELSLLSETASGNQYSADNRWTDVTEAKVRLRFEWDWKVAERELNRALDLRYDYPTAHQWYAAYQVAKSLFEKSNGNLHSDNKPPLHLNLPTQIVSGEPSAAERLQVLCTVAREQIAVCNYEAAELILQGWAPQNDWPKLGPLAPHAAADLLFTLGLLTTSLATTRQTANGHRRAAALLNGSIAIFENLGRKARSVEARAELARCYYRQGLFDIARETLAAALRELPADHLEIKCLCLIYWGMLERDAGRLPDAMSKLKEAATVMAPAGRLVTIRYHLELAGTLRELSLVEDHVDEIRLHYAQTLYESDAIGDHRTTATAENNMGLCLLNQGAWEESEQHLVRARRFFEVLKDSSRRAQVNETLTRLYVATKRYSLAHQTIEDAIQVLELTDGEAILSEALTTSGIVASRLRHFGRAQKMFEAAYKVAERCGDREGRRRALVSMYEEIGHRLNRDELCETLEKLKKLQEVTELSSLIDRLNSAIAHIKARLIKKRRTTNRKASHHS